MSKISEKWDAEEKCEKLDFYHNLTDEEWEKLGYRKVFHLDNDE